MSRITKLTTRGSRKNVKSFISAKLKRQNEKGHATCMDFETLQRLLKKEA